MRAATASTPPPRVVADQDLAVTLRTRRERNCLANEGQAQAADVGSFEGASTFILVVGAPPATLSQSLQGVWCTTFLVVAPISIVLLESPPLRATTLSAVSANVQSPFRCRSGAGLTALCQRLCLAQHGSVIRRPGIARGGGSAGGVFDAEEKRKRRVAAGRGPGRTSGVVCKPVIVVDRR